MIHPTMITELLLMTAFSSAEVALGTNAAYTMKDLIADLIVFGLPALVFIKWLITPTPSHMSYYCGGDPDWP